MNNCVMVHPDKLGNLLRARREEEFPHLIAKNGDSDGDSVYYGDRRMGDVMPDDVWVSRIVDAAAVELWGVVAVWSTAPSSTSTGTTGSTTYVLLQPR